jgi:hypothetical protein
MAAAEPIKAKAEEDGYPEIDPSHNNGGVGGPVTCDCDIAPCSAARNVMAAAAGVEPLPAAASRRISFSATMRGLRGYLEGEGFPRVPSP